MKTLGRLLPFTLINDMNELGEVAGWTTAGGTGVQAYVVGPNHAFETLPLPHGDQSERRQGQGPPSR